MARWQQGLKLGRKSTRWRPQDRVLPNTPPVISVNPLVQYPFGGTLGSRLFRFQNRVIPPLSQGATTQIITGKARITATTTQTITGVARITNTSSQTITGKARIQITSSQTITGKARITATTTQTISGVARITATTTKTITGKARITVTTPQTITGKARIQVTTPQTITGVSRITATTSQIISGIARITNTTTQMVSGVSRITAKTTKTITGVARLTPPAYVNHPMKSLIMDLDLAYLGTTLGSVGDTLPLTVVSSAPSGAPPNNVGLQIQISGGVVTIWVWDGVTWQSK